jgi:16S rRNA (guanine527-N7)-methyltransferase
VIPARELADGAAELGVALDPQQLDRLQRYAELLQRWNRVHNLTAIEPEQMLSHHLLDSLSIVPVVTARTEGRDLPRVLDVGAGGGLPGIPLAIARPELQVTLLDKTQKKVAFLRQAKLELKLPGLEAVHARVEDFRAPPFHLILARAFASLHEFVRLTTPLLADGGCWCAMKGALPRDEIEQLEGAALAVRIAEIVKLRVPRLDAERHLILIEPR